MLQYAKENDLVLTNTLLPHKLAHRTTWKSLERINPHLTHDGTTRRNPYRNQIDYIIIKNMHKVLIKNSRSYGGISIQTDYKFVKATLKLDWYRMKQQKIKSVTYNIEKLKDPDIRNTYSVELNKKLASYEHQNEKPTISWNRIAIACKETAKHVLGLKHNQHKTSTSIEIRELSSQQKKLKNDAESTTDKTKRLQLKQQRNSVMRQIKQQLKMETNAKLDKELQDVERYKDDSNKCYQEIRKINSQKPKKTLAIFDEQNQFVASETEQLQIITEYFTKLFSSTDVPKPVKIDPPYTAAEIFKASSKLKDGKAIGKDGVHAEFIKYSTGEIHVHIAIPLNQTSESGEYPEDQRHGIINPLPKPPKKNERVNVRPIILLSVLRKILTITLIDR